MNSRPAASLHDHYHQPDLTARILKALRRAGLDPDHLKYADLELLDEFHIRGKQATRELAALCGLQENHEVLDLGCGIGGPARVLAAEFGCRVLGLDLVTSYCEAARVLTKLTGLEGKVGFLQGDMAEMPFVEASFDRVWSQHTLMNIADKAALATEVRRLLRPGGKAVFYEVCSSSSEPVHLPVAWASAPQHNHLCRANELRSLLTASGLVEEVWEDVSEASLAWLENMFDRLKNPSESPRPRLGPGLLMGSEAALKSRNLGRNLREGRVVVVRGVFKIY